VTRLKRCLLPYTATCTRPPGSGNVGITKRHFFITGRDVARHLTTWEKFAPGQRRDPRGSWQRSPGAGRLRKALFHYGKAQDDVEDVYVAVYGDMHPLVAGSHLGLGNVYESLGNYEKALFHYGKAQEMYVAVYGDMHQDVASTNLKS